MIDRIQYAVELCRSKSVVDIGGARMNHDGDSAFDRAYSDIRRAAKSYIVVDRHPSADIHMNLDNPLHLFQALHGAEVVLCMETLEHLKNPGLVCDAIRGQVMLGAHAFVTVPRSSVFYRYLERFGLWSAWSPCHHLYAFHRQHATQSVLHANPIHRPGHRHARRVRNNMTIVQLYA